MKERFSGESGARILLETLKEQKIVAGNVELARQIACTGQLIDVAAGAKLIEQGGDDNDLYLIVAGSFDVVVNGRVVNRRLPNDHAGEMAAIQPTQRRAATLIAREDSVVVKLSEPQLAELGNKYPQIWLCFAKELARRLEQRNALVTAVSDKIRVFIISSAEAIEIARTIQNAFDHDPFSVAVWTDGVFRASHYAIESLERVAIAMDGYPDKRAALAEVSEKQRLFIRSEAQRAVNAIRLIMVTGARKGEVLLATWNQFDLERGVWTKPSHNTKQKRVEHVPLNDQAIAFLKLLPREGEYLFPGRMGAHLTDLKFPWATICEDARLEGVRIHDLRHTYASHLVSRGASLPMIGQLLGHTQPQTTARYAHLADNPLREAANLFPVVLAGSGVKFSNDRNVNRIRKHKERNYRKGRGRKKSA